MDSFDPNEFSGLSFNSEFEFLGGLPVNGNGVLAANESASQSQQCTGCAQYKADLDRKDHKYRADFHFLKSRVIHTDLLIRRLKTRQDECDRQGTEIQQLKRKLEQVTNDSETLSQQLKKAIENVKPLQEEKEKLESELAAKKLELRKLNDRLEGDRALRCQQMAQDEHNRNLEHEVTKLKRSNTLLTTKNRNLESRVKDLMCEQKGLGSSRSIAEKRQENLALALKEAQDMCQAYWARLEPLGLTAGEKKPNLIPAGLKSLVRKCVNKKNEGQSNQASKQTVSGGNHSDNSVSESSDSDLDSIGNTDLEDDEVIEVKVGSHRIKKPMEDKAGASQSTQDTGFQKQSSEATHTAQQSNNSGMISQSQQKSPRRQTEEDMKSSPPNIDIEASKKSSRMSSQGFQNSASESISHNLCRSPRKHMVHETDRTKISLLATDKVCLPKLQEAVEKMSQRKMSTGTSQNSSLGKHAENEIRKTKELERSQMSKLNLISGGQKNYACKTEINGKKEEMNESGSKLGGTEKLGVKSQVSSSQVPSDDSSLSSLSDDSDDNFDVDDFMDVGIKDDKCSQDSLNKDICSQETRQSLDWESIFSSFVNIPDLLSPLSESPSPVHSVKSPLEHLNKANEGCEMPESGPRESLGNAPEMEDVLVDSVTDKCILENLGNLTPSDQNILENSCNIETSSDPNILENSCNIETSSDQNILGNSCSIETSSDQNILGNSCNIETSSDQNILGNSCSIETSSDQNILGNSCNIETSSDQNILENSCSIETSSDQNILGNSCSIETSSDPNILGKSCSIISPSDLNNLEDSCSIETSSDQNILENSCSIETSSDQNILENSCSIETSSDQNILENSCSIETSLDWNFIESLSSNNNHLDILLKSCSNKDVENMNISENECSITVPADILYEMPSEPFLGNENLINVEMPLEASSNAQSLSLIPSQISDYTQNIAVIVSDADTSAESVATVQDCVHTLPLVCIGSDGLTCTQDNSAGLPLVQTSSDSPLHIQERSDCRLPLVQTSSDSLPHINNSSDSLTLAQTSSDSLTLAQTSLDSLPLVHITPDILPLVQTSSDSLPHINNSSDSLTLAQTSSDSLTLAQTSSDILPLVQISPDIFPFVHTRSDSSPHNNSSDSLTFAQTISDSSPHFNNGSKSLTLVHSSSDSLPLLQTSSDSLPLVQASSDSLPLVQTSSDSLPLVQASSDSLPLVQASSDSLPHVQASSDSLPLVQASSDSLPLVHASSDSLPHAQTSSELSALNGVENDSERCTKSENILGDISDLSSSGSDEEEENVNKEKKQQVVNDGAGVSAKGNLIVSKKYSKEDGDKLQKKETLGRVTKELDQSDKRSLECDSELSSMLRVQSNLPIDSVKSDSNTVMAVKDSLKGDSHFVKATKDSFKCDSNTVMATNDNMESDLNTVMATKDSMEKDSYFVMAMKGSFECDSNTVMATKDNMNSYSNIVMTTKDTMNSDLNIAMTTKDNMKTDSNTDMATKDSMKSYSNTVMATKDSMQSDSNTFMATKDSLKRDSNSVMAIKDSFKCDSNIVMATNDNMESDSDINERKIRQKCVPNSEVAAVQSRSYMSDKCKDKDSGRHANRKTTAQSTTGISKTIESGISSKVMTEVVGLSDLSETESSENDDSLSPVSLKPQTRATWERKTERGLKANTRNIKSDSASMATQVRHRDSSEDTVVQRRSRKRTSIEGDSRVSANKITLEHSSKLASDNSSRTDKGKKEPSSLKRARQTNRVSPLISSDVSPAELVNTSEVRRNRRGSPRITDVSPAEHVNMSEVRRNRRGIPRITDDVSPAELVNMSEVRRNRRGSPRITDVSPAELVNTSEVRRNRRGSPRITDDVSPAELVNTSEVRRNRRGSPRITDDVSPAELVNMSEVRRNRRGSPRITDDVSPAELVNMSEVRRNRRGSPRITDDVSPAELVNMSEVRRNRRGSPRITDDVSPAELVNMSEVRRNRRGSPRITDDVSPAELVNMSEVRRNRRGSPRITYDVSPAELVNTSEVRRNRRGSPRITDDVSPAELVNTPEVRRNRRGSPRITDDVSPANLVNTPEVRRNRRGSPRITDDVSPANLVNTPEVRRTRRISQQFLDDVSPVKLVDKSMVRRTRRISQQAPDDVSPVKLVDISMVRRTRRVSQQLPDEVSPGKLVTPTEVRRTRSLSSRSSADVSPAKLLVEVRRTRRSSRLSESSASSHNADTDKNSIEEKAGVKSPSPFKRRKMETSASCDLNKATYTNRTNHAGDPQKTSESVFLEQPATSTVQHKQRRTKIYSSLSESFVSSVVVSSDSPENLLDVADTAVVPTRPLEESKILENSLHKSDSMSMPVYDSENSKDSVKRSDGVKDFPHRSVIDSDSFCLSGKQDYVHKSENKKDSVPKSENSVYTSEGAGDNAHVSENVKDFVHSCNSENNSVIHCIHTPENENSFASALENLKNSLNTSEDVKHSVNAAVEESASAMDKVKDFFVHTVEIVKDSGHMCKLEPVPPLDDVQDYFRASGDAISFCNKSAAVKSSAMEIVQESVSSTDEVKDSVHSSQMMKDSFQSSQIVKDSVHSAHMVANSVESSHMVKNSVESSHVVKNLVQTSHMVNNSLQTSQMMEDSVQTSQMANISVQTSQMVTNSVQTSQMVTNSVQTSQMVTNSVQTSQMVTNSVQTSQMMKNSVQTSQMMKNSVDISQTVKNSVQSSSGMKDSVYISKNAEKLEGILPAVEAQRPASNFLRKQNLLPKKDVSPLTTNMPKTNPTVRSRSTPGTPEAHQVTVKRKERISLRTLKPRRIKCISSFPSTDPLSLSEVFEFFDIPPLLSPLPPSPTPEDNEDLPLVRFRSEAPADVVKVAPHARKLDGATGNRMGSLSSQMMEARKQMAKRKAAALIQQKPLTKGSGLKRAAEDTIVPKARPSKKRKLANISGYANAFDAVKHDLKQLLTAADGNVDATVESLLTRVEEENTKLAWDLLCQGVVNYLEGTKDDMFSSLLSACEKVGPLSTIFIKEDEKRLVHLISAFMKLDKGLDHRILMGKIWAAIFNKDCTNQLVRLSYCRMFTCVCMELGDLEQARILVYNIAWCGYLDLVHPVMAIVGVWPEVLSHTNSVSKSSVWMVLKFILREKCKGDGPLFKKVCLVMQRICQTDMEKADDPPEKLLKNLVEVLLQRVRNVIQGCKIDRSFESMKAVELLLIHMGPSWTEEYFVRRHCMSFAMKWENKAPEGSGQPAQFGIYLIRILRAVMSAQPLASSAVGTILGTVFPRLLNGKTSDRNLELACIDAVLELAPHCPEKCMMLMKKWEGNRKDNIPAETSQKLKLVQSILPDKGLLKKMKTARKKRK